MNQTLAKLDLTKLRAIGLDDKRRIDEYVRQNKARGCETSFATIYMWDAAFGFQVLDMDDRLALYNPRLKMLSYPLGAHTPPHELRDILQQFDDAGLIAKDANFVYSVPPNYMELFPNASEVFDMKADLGDADYIYCVDKLISNSGSKLRKKRNHIKQFILACPNFTIEEISEKTLEETKAFMLEQSRARGLAEEASAMERAFDNFGKLGLSGIVMRCPCSNLLVAAAVFSPLAEGVFDVHFEKSTREVEGTAQMMVWQEAVAIKNLGGEFMNREQDMGEENLRKAKESLDPLEKFQRLRAFPR